MGQNGDRFCKNPYFLHSVSTLDMQVMGPYVNSNRSTTNYGSKLNFTAQNSPINFFSYIQVPGIPPAIRLSVCDHLNLAAKLVIICKQPICIKGRSQVVACDPLVPPNTASNDMDRLNLAVPSLVKPNRLSSI